MELKTLQASNDPQVVLQKNDKRNSFKIICKSAGPITIGGKGMPQATITKNESYVLDGEKCKGIVYVVSQRPNVIVVSEISEGVQPAPQPEQSEEE